MSSLAKQSQDFLRKLAHQPVFGKPVIPPVNPSSSTSRPFYKHGFKPPGKKLPTLSVAIQAALITILDYLKKSGKQSRDTYDILAETQIELKAVPGLEAYLQDHPKIAYDPEFNTYTYIPEFVIGSKEELLEWIATRNKYPIETNLLSDSFSGVNEALLELEKEQKIYLLRNKSGNPHLIFYNRWYDPTDYEMNTLFKTEFFKLKVPDEIDLAKQLSQAGIKVGETTESSLASKRKEKKAKEKKRRIKLTNLHLTGTEMDVGKFLNLNVISVSAVNPSSTTSTTSSSLNSSMPSQKSKK